MTSTGNRPFFSPFLLFFHFIFTDISNPLHSFFIDQKVTKYFQIADLRKCNGFNMSTMLTISYLIQNSSLEQLQ